MLSELLQIALEQRLALLPDSGKNQLSSERNSKTGREKGEELTERALTRRSLSQQMPSSWRKEVSSSFTTSRAVCESAFCFLRLLPFGGIPAAADAERPRLRPLRTH
jgi:hypothetical protein